MSRFIESICIRDGIIQNPGGHLARMGRTLMAHHGHFREKLFYPWFDSPVPKLTGKYKWRIVYDQHGVISSSVAEYLPRRIDSLRIMHTDDLDYGYKYLDRSGIDVLMAQKGNASDILIIKNGYLTDSSYANVLLWDGKIWWTPDTPLLPGTQRALLLKKGLIREKPVREKEISSYKILKLINAMLSFDDAPEIIPGPKTIL